MNNLLQAAVVMGVPFILIALVIAAVGFILRRVRPDLYMTDEEKAELKAKQDNEINKE
ncbi:hypothetical protein SAMN02910447_00521 [Ruminococcus sp. YE71]|uniref:hypothetical protein n=1 Tax=unclassified Ruminococcus TaxID=2608920 RepID=UPI000882B9BE|nr:MULTISPECIES: hypothetical protein [unclassified Ruminococcus]SDA12020.1 hypothetical protein SAMN02910446_00520 [Ruminococcus sp. YE78]SFW16106.1 hypothetical protein SAMN02910447_00521 [Ruminococcus sp. YE71]